MAKENGNTTAMVLIVTWAAVSYVLWGMSYTAGDVPLWGVISRMSEVEKDRANLIALARIVCRQSFLNVQAWALKNEYLILTKEKR